MPIPNRTTPTPMYLSPDELPIPMGQKYCTPYATSSNIKKIKGGGSFTAAPFLSFSMFIRQRQSERSVHHDRREGRRFDQMTVRVERYGRIART